MVTKKDALNVVKQLNDAIESSFETQPIFFEVLSFSYAIEKAILFMGTDGDGSPLYFVKLFGTFETETSCTEAEFLIEIGTAEEIIANASERK